MKRSEFYAHVGRTELADQIGNLKTPCYLYFGSVLERQVRKLFDCLGDRFAVKYALKANPHPEILKTLVGLGLGADVASAQELQTSLDAGFSPDTIEFSGPGKQRDELELAVKSRIGCINIENLQEIDTIKQICSERGERAQVGIRINPGRIGSGTGLQMAGDTQFGLSVESAENALGRLKKAERQIKFVGFQKISVLKRKISFVIKLKHVNN